MCTTRSFSRAIAACSSSGRSGHPAGKARAPNTHRRRYPASCTAHPNPAAYARPAMSRFSTRCSPMARVLWKLLAWEVRDYLHADGTVREQSVIRADVAINQKARPLFFGQAGKRKTRSTLVWPSVYARGFGTSEHAEYRGPIPESRLFLTEAGEPFAIVSYGGDGGMRFLGRGGIHGRIGRYSDASV